MNMSERPLVTFALFAYNQEKYIREAVEGAFSQTYQRMEIILSDDCSTDSTFDILNEMASNYRGSKKIIVRKTEKNRGTLLHVADVAKIAKGNLIILAAGDDISKPHRTKVIVRTWLSSRAWGISLDLIVSMNLGRSLQSMKQFRYLALLIIACVNILMAIKAKSILFMGLPRPMINVFLIFWILSQRITFCQKMVL